MPSPGTTEGKRKYLGPFPLPHFAQDEPPFEITLEPGSALEDEIPIILVPRTVWGARPPKSEVPMRFPVSKIKFTSEDIYKRDKMFSNAILKTQDFYMDVLNEPDVPFNFLVDENGLVFEGRGWNACPRYTMVKGDNVLEIAFVGDYSAPNDMPSYYKCDAAHSLILRGVRQQMIDPQYTILSLKDRTTTPVDMKWFPNHDDDMVPDTSQYNH